MLIRPSVSLSGVCSENKVPAAPLSSAKSEMLRSFSKESVCPIWAALAIRKANAPAAAIMIRNMNDTASVFHDMRRRERFCRVCGISGIMRGGSACPRSSVRRAWGSDGALFGADGTLFVGLRLSILVYFGFRVG